MVVKDRLSQFLLQQMTGRQFKLGEWDCGIMLADWYVYSTGKPDPAVHYRGTEYHIDSVYEIVTKVAAEMNLPETLHPKRGDVGIISINDKDGSKITFGAIFAGSRWLLLAQNGSISGISPKLVILHKAWRVPVSAD